MAKQLNWNVMDFVKHWPWEDVAVVKDGLGTAERKEAPMRMSRTATSVWKLPTVRIKFITVDEKRLYTKVTDAPGSVDVSNSKFILDDRQIERLEAPVKVMKHVKRWNKAE